METAFATNWLEANQRALLAAFASLRRRLGGEGSTDPAPEDALADASSATAINRLAEAFALTPFERQLILLCAGTEMDAALAQACGAALGLSRQANPTFGLALSMLDQPHWSALTPGATLRRWRCVDVEPGLTLATSPLHIDERILHFVAGLNELDRRLAPVLRRRAAATGSPQSHAAESDAIVCQLRAADPPAPLIQLAGDDPDGKEDLAARVANELGLHLYVLDVGDGGAMPPDLDLFKTLWLREAALLPAALLVQCGDGPLPSSLRRFLEGSQGLLLLGVRDAVGLRCASRVFDVHKPAPKEQLRLWKEALGPVAPKLNGALDSLALQFRLSADSIRRAGGEIAARAGDADGLEALTWQACRVLGRRRLDDLAQRIEAKASWEDLVVPETEARTLRQIVAQARQRVRVYDSWGFGAASSRGLGISALFVGESGTGKTLAAEVLARELKLDLYCIDLASVVSKYIGETEKNLKQVFDAAEDTGSVLLFDEADALFGKRSEVKDSHDRYANIEVGYLLQRIEAYRGVAILTTNLRTSLDRSFQRRLRFVVEFPFPDASQREAIWQRAFPKEAPVEGVDPRKLAQAHLAGGNIRNIALNAAFLAAEQGGPVTMGHLLAASHSEARKIERSLSDQETRGWL
jgi:hypothetical protein